MAKVSIIGSGIVGTIVGMGLKELGNDVIFYDIDEKKVEQLKQKGLKSTTSMDQAVENSDISFVSVPTPSLNGKIDLTFIKSATGALLKPLRTKITITQLLLKVQLCQKLLKRL